MRGTLTLEHAALRDWDALVIGAGPGGALASRQLALSGLRTLLVERHAFPRNKVCGGCLNGRALQVIRDVALADVFHALRPVSLNRFVLQANQRRVELELPEGAAIKRAGFDAMLVQAAIDAGAEFLPETLAVVEDEGLDYCHVRLRRNHGLAQTAKAKTIVAADGLGHPSLQRIPAFACQVMAHSRIGIGTRITRTLPGYQANTIHMAIAEWGYVGLAQTSTDSWNLAAAFDAAALKQAPCPASLVADTIRAAGLPALPALDICDWQGTLPLTRQSARLATGGIFLLGDAAGYIEPFTGEGMGWALSSALEIVPTVLRSIAKDRESAATRWETTERRRLQGGQSVCRVVSGLLRRPALVGAGLHTLSVFPSLANPLVRRVHSRPGKSSHT